MFSVTQVGSWPRSRELLKALRGKQKNEISGEEFNRVADEAVRRCVQIQLDAGVDIIVDGEQRRDNFYSFITDKVSGTRLMSLAEMLDTVEDKAGFEEMLTTLDVPASAIRNPTCIGKLLRREPLAVDELRFVRQLTDKPVKMTLPGPYLLTRAMWVGHFTSKVYRDKQEMGDDVVKILREELLDLVKEGCEFVQFDEPVLTEIVFSKEDQRTLATRRDAGSELGYAAELLNRVIEGVSSTRIGLHVCRGNWSRSEEVLLSGDYEPLVPCFGKMEVRQFVLEYATPRAGDVDVVGQSLSDREIGLGVVNPRTEETESVETIIRNAERALKHYRPEQIFLNPDCGFGCFANRCVNDEQNAARKIGNIVKAARHLREKYA
jgi:5-methyltetrahydropteroyltriglutamate--homocysteine methyltransferase